jgi:CO/xanthine dehydrogenase FAD-binding subunit
MKLPAFEYASPATMEEAVALLASRFGNAKIISGGQSLVPMLAFRLAAPELLVDLKRLQGLSGIVIAEDGVRLGAKVRWCEIERDERLKGAHPLLVEAIRHVAHYQIRNRGTVGGSLAHADPAAEMPGIAITCDAELIIIGPKGKRVDKASDFFKGALTTSLAPDEVLTEVRLPPVAGLSSNSHCAAAILRLLASRCTTTWLAARSPTFTLARSGLVTGRFACMRWKRCSMGKSLMMLRSRMPRKRHAKA